MYFDLSVPILTTVQHPNQPQSKKSKGKQPQAPSSVTFTPAQLASIENRVDLLVHLGYKVLAFNQTVSKKIDPKTHANILDPLLNQLQKRQGVVFLKRLTIILDEDSEKGFGLANTNIPVVQPYDLLALVPTTQTTFSLACLTHSLPSPLTAHIISLPLTLPRLPFHLKHTLVRTAIKNGAVFEIGYAGALGGESVGVNGDESGAGVKRNWWAAARELVRVTKGKGIIVSGGVTAEADLRAPRDIGNLITLLGLAQNQAHDASTTIPKSLVLRAQTRKTYRAILSEPKLIIPLDTKTVKSLPTEQEVAPLTEPNVSERNTLSTDDLQAGHKRARDEAEADTGEGPSMGSTSHAPEKEAPSEETRRKRKKRKNNQGGR